MNTEAFLKEVEDNLKQIFQAEKAGVRTSARERHRCEGFMRAGTFLGLVSGQELSQLMHSIHMEVFGESIQNRKKKQKKHWPNSSVNYSQYDLPAYERLGKSTIKKTGIKE